MKKALVLLVLILAVGYGVLTYQQSARSEAAALQWTNRVTKSAPFLTATSEYRRGFLKSTQDITIELPVSKLTGKAPGIVVHNVIHHGPLPGFTGVGVARIDHSIVFDDETAKRIAKGFGDAAPLTAVTRVNLAGDGVTELKGAPGNYDGPEGAVAWRGFTATMRFTKDLDSYSGEMSAPGLEVSQKDGSVVAIEAVSLKMNQAKLANTRNLYLGTMNGRVGKLSLAKKGKPEFEVKNASLGSEVSSAGPEFVDIVGRLAADEFRSAAFAGTNAEYAFSARHLHVQSLDKLSTAMQESQAAIAKGTQPALLQSNMMQAMATHGLPLLQREPVIAIDRIGFVTKEGETKVTASARLVGVTDADVQNPLGLLAKLQAEATVRIAEAIMAGFMVEAPLRALKAQGREPSVEEAAQMAAQVRVGLEQQLVGLVAQGLVVREGGILSSRIVFKDGVLTVNGRPFNPMGGAAAPR